MTLRAVIFDLGGVVLRSPMQVFARFETSGGLPRNFINQMVVANGEGGAWSRLERGELALGPQFFEAFDAELSHAGAGGIRASEVMAEVAKNSGVHEGMLRAVRSLRRHGWKTAALTNNWVAEGTRFGAGALNKEFDVFVESAVTGIRKPDPRIYHLACNQLQITPPEAVFLDDIGRNLKTAKALGMATIKVDDTDVALVELEVLVGVPLRA